MKKPLFALVLLGLCAPALAAPAAPQVTVSGQIWGDYSLNTGSNEANLYWEHRGIGYNGANLNRAYITTSARFSPRFSGLVTADANANPGIPNYNLGQLYFLKYAYFQMESPFPTANNLRLGLIPTAWGPTESSFWHYNFHSLDIGSKYLGLTSSAFGIAASGGIDRLHYDLGAYDLPALTSGSYKLPMGANPPKNYQAALSLKLDQGLQLSALYSYYRPLGVSDRHDALTSLLGYQGEILTLAGEYGLGWEGSETPNTQVLSAFGILNTHGLIRNTDLTLRYDNVNRVNGTSHVDWIAGIGIHPATGVNLLLADTLRVPKNGGLNENILGLYYGLYF